MRGSIITQILLQAIVSCGGDTSDTVRRGGESEHEPIVESFPTIPAEILPHVLRFRQEAILRDMTLKGMSRIYWARAGDLKPGWIAACTPRTNEIHLSQEYFRNNSSVRAEQVVFHELGHCMLGRHEHNNVIQGGIGVPVSLMHEQVAIPLDIYVRNRAIYLDELFGKTLISD